MVTACAWAFCINMASFTKMLWKLWVVKKKKKEWRHKNWYDVIVLQPGREGSWGSDLCSFAPDSTTRHQYIFWGECSEVRYPTVGQLWLTKAQSRVAPYLELFGIHYSACVPILVLLCKFEQLIWNIRLRCRTICFLCCEKHHSCSLLRGIHLHAFLKQPAILPRPSEARVDNPTLPSAPHD